MIQTFTVQRDDAIYEAFPDVALTDTGRLVCVFSECTHHGDRAYSRISRATSADRGRTWSPKRPLTEPLYREEAGDPHWNCPRVSTLADGRLVAVADRITTPGDDSARQTATLTWISDDAGETWRGPRETPVEGIVPDQLVELREERHRGRWLLGAHAVGPDGVWTQRVWYSDDEGGNWAGPVTVAADSDLELCEGGILELPDGELVCFMRENSGTGQDAYKAISEDGGETWDGPYRMAIPGCHRPVAGVLESGDVLITHRYMQGGSGWTGWWTQNAFAALTDVESCLARSRDETRVRILPLDYDRSVEADTGYTGWVQFDDGEVYVVNYIVDDAPVTRPREPSDYDGAYAKAPRAYIRGYAFDERDVVLDPPGPTEE